MPTSTHGYAVSGEAYGRPGSALAKRHREGGASSLTHSVDFEEATVLCARVKFESILDDEEIRTPAPTCTVCVARLVRIYARANRTSGAYLPVNIGDKRTFESHGHEFVVGNQSRNLYWISANTPGARRRWGNYAQMMALIRNVIESGHLPLSHLPPLPRNQTRGSMRRQVDRATGSSSDAYGFRSDSDAVAFIHRVQARAHKAKITRRGNAVHVFSGRVQAANEFWESVDLKNRYVIRYDDAVHAAAQVHSNRAVGDSSYSTYDSGPKVIPFDKLSVGEFFKLKRTDSQRYVKVTARGFMRAQNYNGVGGYRDLSPGVLYGIRGRSLIFWV